MRALFTTVLLAMAIPMNATAAICVGYSDYDSTKCKIPLCALRPGGFSTSKCHSPLALMAWRAFWGNPPIPLPPSECGCNWIPPLLIPTDQYGVPLSATKDSSFNLTPFNKVSSDVATTQYAQAQSADTNSVMVFEKNDNGNDNHNEAVKPVTAMSALERKALAADIMAKQTEFSTTCNQNSFRRSGKSSSCYTVTENSRTDISMQHSSYRSGGIFGSRRHKYDYIIRTRSLNGSSPTTEIRMEIDHDSMTYCQRFVGGAAVTDRSCGVANLNSVVTTPPSNGGSTDPNYPTDPSFPIDDLRLLIP